MNQPHPPDHNFNLGRILRKFFLSAFVVVSFILYALHKPFAAADSAINPAAPTAVAQEFMPELAPTTSDPAQTPPPENTPLPSATPRVLIPTSTPRALLPTAVPPTPAVSAATGRYKDGTYQGPQVNAFFGWVQVQTVIQNGRIASVQFLQFPQDRRTSARINSFAVPALQQEAIQAQSASVNIITGATLTSEAFKRSLQSALSSAGS